MANMAENVIPAGSETHPPMLEKGMYDSWKTQIILYIRGKENGEMLRDSVEHGPSKFKSEITIKDTNGVTDIRRAERLEDFKRDDKLRYDNDIKVVNILLLGLPLYAFLKHNERDAKEVQEMRQGFPEPLALLANTYNPPPSYSSNQTHHLHFKAQVEWVCHNSLTSKKSHSVTFDQLYAFLKHNERDTKEVQVMRQGFPEPLALLANTYNPLPSYSSNQTQYPAQPSKVYQPYRHYKSSTLITQQLIQSPPLQSYAPLVVQQPPTFQPDIGLAIPTFLPTNDPIATIIQNDQVTVQNVQGRQSQGYAGNAGNNQASGAWVINAVRNIGANQPRVIRCYNCKGEGHMAKQCTTRKRVKDSEWFKDKNFFAQQKKAEVVNFKADHVDAYDSDCDDKVTANAIFMANLSHVGSLNDDTETLILAEESRLKMLEKQTVVNTKPIDYSKLNKLYEICVLQTQLSTEKLYWSSIPRPPVTVSKTKVYPKKLPSTSQVLGNLNNTRDLLTKFDECINRRTTLSPHEIGSWEQSDLKVAKKSFEIEKKQLLINNDRLLEENIAIDIMCTYLRSLNEVDNYGKCKSLDIVLLDLQESNKSLSKLRKHFSKLEEYSITLDIAFQNHKEQMILNDPDTKNKQFLVKTINNQSIEINDLKVQLQDKLHVINELKHILAQKSQKTQCELPIFDSRSQKIEDEHVSLAFQCDYLKVTKEHVATLQELLEEARALKPLDEHIGHTSKFVERIQELLVYVSASCPFTQSGNEKWAPTTSHKRNNKPYVDASRTKQTIETITKKHAVKQNTRKTDNTMFPSTGRVSSTNSSGSKARSNTKNDKIPQPSGRSMKNKIEAHHKKFKSSANKNNNVSHCNANVKNVALSKNSDTICLSWNECLFLANHDACVENHAPSSSDDTSTIVVPPGHILTTTVIPVNVPCLKLSLRYANARESLSKCMINSDFHPFNLYNFGFEGIIWYEELPPWKFDYLGIVKLFVGYLNSGFQHMTRHRDKLINFVSKFIRMVRFDKDHFAAIMGYGDLQMRNILISRVYYVEGLGHNLFSVGQFYDSDLEVALRKHTCFLQNLEGVDLLSGSRGYNIYTISMVDMMNFSPICLLSKASKTKSWLWNRRLSHLNFGTINKLAKQGLVKGLPKLKYTKDHLCSACQMGKSKK
ncbi:retrovirus-related pol polyprotein from transposon TNT 1-94 [Tanacetum coccineum]